MEINSVVLGMIFSGVGVAILLIIILVVAGQKIKITKLEFPQINKLVKINYKNFV